MSFRTLLALAVLVLTQISAMAAGQAPAPTASAVSVMSTWPQGDVLRSGDSLLVTTFSAPGENFHCKLRSLDPDALVCGKRHDKHPRAFERGAVQSITFDPHRTHRVSVSIALGSLLLFVGGIACAEAGGSEACAVLLASGLTGALVSSIAHYVELIRGPGELKVVYVANPTMTPVTP